MRNRLHAPILWNRDAGGYRFEASARTAGPRYQLPGLWFSAAEIHALLTMQQLLDGLDTGGLLGPHVQPLMARLNGLLGSADNTADEVRRRIRVLGATPRRLVLAHFQTVGAALPRRRRLHIVYHARTRDEVSEREISPQRLVHYRDNWYLDAWCHLRQALRSFAVDAITQARLVNEPAHDVAERTLDEELGAGYGIFGGRAQHLARLRFSPRRARWVAAEQWHPRQKGEFDAQGRYVLEVPYADPRELAMDILRHGPEIEVLEPADLRAAITTAVADMAALYRPPPADPPLRESPAR